eukprot:scaffold492951_cov46-Prasinocladus_malaysianus.AAC.1
MFMLTTPTDTSSPSTKHPTRPLPQTSATEDLASGEADTGAGVGPGTPQVTSFGSEWHLPAMQRAKLEHEQEVLARKREEAGRIRRRLEAIPGS